MKKIDEFVDNYIKNKELSPGFSLAVIGEGKCIYNKSFGFSNLENKVPINSKTTFYIASLAKSFTAAGIMILHEKFKLDLFDNIKKYFSDLPECYSHVKIINLINHTSGIKDYFTIYENNNKSTDNITINDVYNFILKENELEFPCNSKFGYSNTGYVLLTLLIEKLCNQSFSDFLQDNFFKPLGMENTYVFTEDKPVIPNRAYGYRKNEGKYYNYDYLGLTTGDGGIYSSIDDLILWMQAFDNGKIFKEETIRKIFLTNKLNDGNQGKYGFGWFILNKNNKKVTFHAGQYNGFTNIMIKIPQEKISIIILTNYYEDIWQSIFKNVHDFAMENLMAAT